MTSELRLTKANVCRYIDPPIFSPADLVILRWAYKHAREIGRRMKFYDGDIQVGHPTFAEGSQAATTQQAGTAVEISAPKIVYSKEDDDVIDEFHRRTGSYSVN